ncbi:hypothetical protein NQ994_08065, partial [Acinetobacter baumannii]|nr:hypothetical protein [Acinetobacter baumannii]
MALTPEVFRDLERDIADTGKAVNVDAEVNPRYGLPFKSLPMVSRLFEAMIAAGYLRIDDLQSAIDIAAAAGAGANGWTDQLIVTSDGKTQKQWNDEVKTYLDNFPFYIPYSSLIDDYADQIELAIQVGRPILFTQDATYVVKRKIAVNSLTKALNITGNNAIIKYDGPADLDRIFEIQHSMPLNHVIYSLEIDANLKASSCLRIYAVEENAN